MSTMEQVISELKQSRYIDAIKSYRTLTGSMLNPAKNVIDALRPYLDPSYPGYVHKPPMAPEAIPEASQAQGDISASAWAKATGLYPSEPTERANIPKAPIHKWIVTGISPRNELYFIQYLSAENAEEGAQIICNEGYKKVSISQVIAEGKYTISL